jgi:hypothetical protein
VRLCSCEFDTLTQLASIQSPTALANPNLPPTVEEQMNAVIKNSFIFWIVTWRISLCQSSYGSVIESVTWTVNGMQQLKWSDRFWTSDSPSSRTERNVNCWGNMNYFISSWERNVNCQRKVEGWKNEGGEGGTIKNSLVCSRGDSDAKCLTDSEPLILRALRQSVTWTVEVTTWTTLSVCTNKKFCG